MVASFNNTFVGFVFSKWEWWIQWGFVDLGQIVFMRCAHFELGWTFNICAHSDKWQRYVLWLNENCARCSFQLFISTLGNGKFCSSCVLGIKKPYIFPLIKGKYSKKFRRLVTAWNATEKMAVHKNTIAPPKWLAYLRENVKERKTWQAPRIRSQTF